MSSAYFILDKGYKSVTTRQIVARAQIFKDNLCHYFKSKEYLFAQTIQEHFVHSVIIKAATDDMTATAKEHFNIFD